MLQDLAHAYCFCNRPDSAAILYNDEAKRVAPNFPHLALRYLHCALHYYAMFPSEEASRAQIQHQLAEIHYQQGQLTLAILHINKAIQLVPDASDRCIVLNKDLQKWQTEQHGLIEIIGESIYSQLDSCINMFCEIQQLYLSNLEQGHSLSERTKNRTTELLIKIRGVLDQSYIHFVREMILEPNGQKTGDLYFPFAGSKKSLKKELVQRKIIPVITKRRLEDGMAPLRVKVIDILMALQRKGYLDLENKKSILAQEDQEFTLLDVEFDPYKPKIIELLRKLTVGEMLTKRVLGEAQVNKPICISPDIVLQALVAKGYIEQTAESVSKPSEPGAWRITDAFLQLPASQSLQLGAGTKEEPQLKLYERIIARILHLQLKSLDKDYPECYKAILEQQAFYYYHEDRAAGSWQASWLEKINAIHNDSKHIRLTPQGIENKLTELSGLINKQQVKIFIHYLEPSFYFWSFVDGIADSSKDELTDAQRANLSRNILSQLRTTGYLEHKKSGNRTVDKVVHPDVLALVESIKRGCVHDEERPLKLAFQDKLKLSLPVEAQPYTVIIGNLLLRRALQQGHVQLDPDLLVDAPKLIESAIHHTIEFCKLFGRTRLQYQLAQQPQAGALAVPKQGTLRVQQFVSHVMADTTLLRQEQKLNDRYVYCMKQYELTPGLTELRDCHLSLKHLVYCYRYQRKFAQAGMLYFDAGARLEANYPWLALKYYNKAIRDFENAELTHAQQLIESHNGVVRILSAGHMINEAISHLKQASFLTRPEVFAEQTKALEEQQRSHNFIDLDLVSQLEHAYKQYMKFLYLSFKLTYYAEDYHSVQLLHSYAIEIIIKIRHLLDQGFGRFIKEHVYRPRQNPETDIHYPYVGSEDGLKKELVVKKMLGYDIYFMQIEADTQLPDLSSRAMVELPILLKKGDEFHVFGKKASGIVTYTKLDTSVLPSVKDIKSIQPTDKYHEIFPINIDGKTEIAKVVTFLKLCDAIIRADGHVQIYCQTDQQTASLSLDSHREVFHVLNASQPYSYYDVVRYEREPEYYQRCWLDKIVGLSNGAKHVGFKMSTTDDLIQTVKQAKTVNDIYHMRYQENIFYDWSFAECYLGNIEKSKNLVQELTRVNLIKDGEIAKGEQKLKILINLAKKLIESDLQGSPDVNALRQNLIVELRQSIPMLEAETDDILFAIINRLLQGVDSKLATMMEAAQIAVAPLIARSLGETEKLLTVFFSSHSVIAPVSSVGATVCGSPPRDSLAASVASRP